MYCERYTIAFKDLEWGEMVIHAPPFNVLCVLFLPFSLIPDSNIRIQVSKLFSLGVYWLENIILVISFIMFELCLLPIVYVCCLFNIGLTTKGLFTTVFNIFVWCFAGFLILLCILFMDTCTLLKILSMHNGCIENEEIQKAEINT